MVYARKNAIVPAGALLPDRTIQILYQRNLLAKQSVYTNDPSMQDPLPSQAQTAQEYHFPTENPKTLSNPYQSDINTQDNSFWNENVAAFREARPRRPRALTAADSITIQANREEKSFASSPAKHHRRHTMAISEDIPREEKSDSQESQGLSNDHPMNHHIGQSLIKVARTIQIPSAATIQD